MKSKQWTTTVLIAFLAFIGIGLTAGLLGLAWPSMQAQFTLPLDGVNAIYIAQTVTYSIAGFFIGRVMTRFGSGTTLLAGAVLLALTMFGIAASSTWLLIILFSLVFGFGNGLIDAGLNLYIATYHSPRQMNLLHACFGIGITIGPLIMTFVLGQKWAWQVGYAIVAGLLITLIVLFAFTRRQWRNDGFSSTTKETGIQRMSTQETLQRPVVWFGIITFLAYVGVELGIGQWAYTILTESRGIPTETAGLWVSIYWGAFTGGRILWGVIGNRFAIEKVLRYSMIVTLLGAVLFWWQPVPILGLVALIIAGFAQAPIFPMLMAGTARRVGAGHAENTIGLQMAGVGAGGALLPGLIGTVGKTFGLEMMAASFILMAVIVFIFHELAIRPQKEKIKRMVVEPTE